MRSMARVGAYFLFSSVILTTLWHSGDTAIAGHSQMATEFESPTWTPSECSFTTITCTVETQDCFEVCNWTDEEESDGEWTVCEWTSEDSTCASTEAHEADGDFPPIPRGDEFGVSPERIPFFPHSPLRRSPRVPKQKAKFDPSSSVTSEEGWQLSSVMELQGCQPHCVTQVHGLSEYDVLIAHSTITTKSPSDKCAWMLEYFSTNCPHTPEGAKDPKNMQFILCGRSVCQAVWQAVLSISNSRFYQIRKDFLAGKRAERSVRIRALAPKSMAAVAWMRSYFNRVGDKRPDKDGIYLPSSLSERVIYQLMAEDASMREGCVCFSQFNKLFRTHFPNVTIPKVSTL